MSVTAWVCPYKTFIQNVQEVFNEVTVLVASYHLFCFTEFIWDQERRYELGWSLVGTIVLNVIFNFAILGWFICKTCCASLKTRYKKKRQVKRVLKHKQKVSVAK